MPQLTNEIIEAAIQGLENKKAHIDSQISELRQMMGGKAAAAPATKAKGGRRKFSAEAIERMREAQKRRWAKVKGKSDSAPSTAAKSTAAKAPKKRKSRLSAAGRKAISEAAKKRWAARRAVA